MRLLLSTLVLVTSTAAWSQKPPIKFGDIPMEDMEMTVYQKDSSAEAVILADYGQSSLVYTQINGFSLKFERHLRIKILTKDGLDYANILIPLYHNDGRSEKLGKLKAATYNLESQKVIETKMKAENVFKEKRDENIYIARATLPNARVGSVLDISYEVESDFLFNFQDWEFQGLIPKRWSEYRAVIPEYFGYDKYMQGYVSLDINEHEQAPASIVINTSERSGHYTTQTTYSNDKVEYIENRFRWVAKDVQAFKPEPFMTTSSDYISRMNFELAFTKFPNQGIKTYMGSWGDINRQFWSSSEFGGEVTGNSFLKGIVDKLIDGIPEPEKKINAIANFVKENVSWDGDQRKFTTKSLRKVLEEKKGNSAEINLLLISMLDKADIKANPVLISTRDHGFVREQVPISSQFNYVICLATMGDKKVLIDATEKLLSVGVLPERCLNGRGLVIDEKEYSWADLQINPKSRHSSNADLVLSEDGIFSGKLQVERSGLEALEGRKQYLSRSEDECVADFVRGRPWTISSREILNIKDIQLPLKEVYKLDIAEAVDVTGDVMYFKPIIFDRIEANPFKSEKRDYPVDYGSSFDRIYMCRIALPSRFFVDELPKPKVINLPSNAGKYTYSVTMSGNVVNVISNLQVNKSLFTQEEYPNLREFFNQILAKQAEQIVLKKK